MFYYSNRKQTRPAGQSIPRVSLIMMNFPPVFGRYSLRAMLKKDKTTFSVEDFPQLPVYEFPSLSGGQQ